MPSKRKYPPYLRPFFTFFGGKWRIAPSYPTPKFKTLIEPFAGSAGYAMNHYRHDVILIERDPVIFSVWDFLIHAMPRDILDLPEVHPENGILESLPAGAQNLIGFWCARGANAPRKRLTGWGRSGKYPDRYWGLKIKQRIAAQVPHIKHWQIIRGSGIKFMREHPTTKATWFIDPPYQFSGGDKYIYSCFQINYPRLAKAITNLDGQIICCEGEGAKYLPFRDLLISAGNNGRSHVERIFTR